MLGLDHPGQRLPKKPKSGSSADYDADSKSLMGRGTILRPADFDDAFCKHIK